MADSLLISLALLASLLSLALAFLIVYVRDLIYASGMLALLGGLTAGIAALLGYYLVAAFIIIIYVGAAVMFIIISVSMLGGGGAEERVNPRGLLLGLVTLLGLGFVVFRSPLEVGSVPVAIEVGEVAGELLIRYAPVVILLMVALAATIIEAIAVARR
ncbi:MAG: NADH-quinone oxidoreductase subunit J [Acidilobaceae archaeon]|nr:NADH-quinone oxidoreductase subunit J [Acidilobaceae archaeon]MCX8165792.1 NADH-quinone oxidoreductase subunit J [Acidilobaceae archaeon]MDW7974217.1 NADH-quinone oxidoreductase subunit J [Sulfolobales archaeon]